MKDYTPEELARLRHIAAVADRIWKGTLRDPQHPWRYLVAEHLIDELVEALYPADMPFPDYQRDDTKGSATPR